MKKTVLHVILLFFAVCTHAQFRTDIPLPQTVRHDTLPNGMQYFVMHNEWPKDRVDFYFVQNVGAILEEDNQDGLAHFLEHMAFNGSEHFKGKGIIDMLERHGVKFGRDINAYTAYDETVYNLSNVPVEDRQLLDSCLYVMHDWSGALLLTDREIDAERGVIREEWRTRRNSGFRMRAQIDQVMFEGSKYADRDVIGDLDVINNFGYEQLRDYYHKWYLPQNQAVIVVGDIDAAYMEDRIREILGIIPASVDKEERYYASIPDHKEPGYVLATDKEARSTGITLSYKITKPRNLNEPALEDNMKIRVAVRMMNNRFREYVLNNETSALSYGVGFSDLARLYHNFGLSINPKKGEIAEAFEDGYRELVRALRFGFTEEELSRVKTEMLSGYRNRLNNRDKISNQYWVGQLQQYFLEASPVMDTDAEYEWLSRFLEKVTVADINPVFTTLTEGINPVLAVSGPEDEDQDYPAADIYWDIMKSVASESLKPYTEEVSQQPLVKDVLNSVKSPKGKSLKDFPGAKAYILQNGARVVIYPTTLSQDEIVFTAYSPGGLSLVPVNDLPSANLSAVLAGYSGLGDYKFTDLQKKLSGTTASVSPYIGGLYEGFNGSSNREDLETLLQLTYLYFRSPRFDENTFAKLKEQYEDRLSNSGNDNGKIFKDTITRLNGNRDPRVLLLNSDFVEALNMEKAESFYRERMENVGDFTFVFIGNIGEKDLSGIFKYLGNIPGNKQKEHYEVHHIGMARGKNHEVLTRSMDVPKTSVYRHLENKKAEYSRRNALITYIISQWLNKRFMETIREEEGGSYGVQVMAALSDVPVTDFSIEIMFDCNPEKTEDLLRIVDAELQRVVQEDIPVSLLQDIRKQIVKSQEEQVKNNLYWQGALLSYLREGEKPLSLEALQKVLNGISPEDLRTFAAKTIPSSDVVEVVMKPE